MAKEEIKKEAKKEVTTLVLKPEHSKSTLTHKGVDYNTEFATQEQLQVLYAEPIWKYLFEN